LFYQKGKDDFICASELGALGMLAKRPWNEDMDSTADYLRYGFYLPGTTAYEHVREVMPGCVLIWNPEKGATEKPFWKLNVGGFTGNRQNAAALLKEKLVKAVKRRLVADVEVGAFLSGGVDSSLVVSILSRYLGKKEDLKTFTIGFSDGSFDESRYAAIVAETCGTGHIVKRFDRFEPDRLTRLILNSVGQPFADSSLLPTAMVSEVAASRLKVSLSGDGGDELFSGYQRYQARAILRWYSQLPEFFRNNVENAVRLLPEPMSHHSRSFLKKAHLFLDIATRNKNAKPYVAPEWYSESEFNRLCPDLALRGHNPPGFPLTAESYH
jgi:asparagine synthase (glutamine-hydrolysing)